MKIIFLIFALLFISNLKADSISQSPGTLNSNNWSQQRCTQQGGCIQIQWRALNRVTTTDNNGAQCQNMGQNQYSEQMFMTNFGLNVPSFVQVTGISVRFLRYAISSTQDYIVTLILNGNEVVATDRCAANLCTGGWQVSQSQQYRNDTYGGPTDLWGLGAITPADVNNNGFGVSMVALHTSGQTSFIDVDYVELTVHYSTGSAGLTASEKKAQNSAVAAVVTVLVLCCIIGAIIIGFFWVRKNRPDLLERFQPNTTHKIHDVEKNHQSQENGQTSNVNSQQQSAHSSVHQEPGWAQQPVKKVPSINPSPPAPVAVPMNPPHGHPPPQARASPSPPQQEHVQQPVKKVPSINPPAPVQQPVKKVPSVNPPEEQPLRQSPSWNSKNSNSALPQPQQTQWNSNPPIQRSPSWNSDFNTQSAPAPQVEEGSFVAKSKLPVKANYRSTPNAYGNNIMFGVPLEHARKINGIPSPVELTIAWLEANALQEPGIIRVSGSNTEIKNIKATFDSGRDVDPSTVTQDPHVISGVLKLYLRELPQVPLLMTVGLKDAADGENPADYLESLANELNQIPEVNYYLLKRLFGYLYQVAQNEPYNKMTPDNLGIVFGPTLKLPISLIATMVYYYPQIFS